MRLLFRRHLEKQGDDIVFQFDWDLSKNRDGQHPDSPEMADDGTREIDAYQQQFVVLTDEPMKADKRPRPRASVIVESLLEAILATVYLDKLVGIDYHLCALPDCWNYRT